MKHIDRYLLMRLPSVFFVNLLLYVVRGNDLSLDPIGVGADRSVYIVKAGLKFIVACEYNGDEATDEHSLQWINEASVPIEPSISILTQARQMNGRIKRSLIFVKIQKHDAGEYKCRAELRNGEFVTRSIHLIVLSNIDWNTPNNKVGGVLGDSLTIDCGAKGEPTPLIEITDELGQAVNSSIFKATGSEVTIEKLTKEMQGLKFQCLAVQTININSEFNTTTTDVHELVVDVWYKPEFEYNEVERYAITHKNVSLLCLVTDSNPPARHFSFYKDREILYNHERYEVIPNMESQASVLKIDYIEEQDFGRYKCVVNNGKLKAEQTIVLKKTINKIISFMMIFLSPVWQLMDPWFEEVRSFGIEESRQVKLTLPILRRRRHILMICFTALNHLAGHCEIDPPRFFYPLEILKTIPQVSNMRLGHFHTLHKSSLLLASHYDLDGIGTKGNVECALNQPPKQPTVSVEQVSNSSIIFRILENREEGDLPVLSYSIIYTLNIAAVPKENVAVHQQEHGQAEQENTGMPSERRSVIRQKNEANLYEIHGLQPFQQYDFLVYPKSEAGQGDPVLVKVITGSTGGIVSSATISNIFCSSFLLITAFQCFLDLYIL